MISLKDNTINKKNKPGFAHFDSCEKAWNYINELETVPVGMDDLIDTPITIHHLPSMQKFLMRAVKKWPMNSDEDRMRRFVLVARIMQATHEQILKYFNIAITKKSKKMIKDQEILAFKQVRDILAKSKFEGDIPIIGGNADKYNNDKTLEL